MGFFAKKQSLDEEMAERERHFLDENFKEELRNHARLYFENVLNENGERFKNQLNETISSINEQLKGHITDRLDGAINEIKTELKEHVSRQVEAQLSEQAKSMKEVQDKALADITESAENLSKRHQELASELEKSLSNQESEIQGVFEDSKSQMTKMKDSHQLALQWLSETVKALQTQHEQLAADLKKHIEEQQNAIVKVFEDNTARVVERYLLEALGDQYDLKAQLPAIIKQMEENKQAMVDDIKL